MPTRFRSRVTPGAKIVWNNFGSEMTNLFEESFFENRTVPFSEYGTTTCQHQKCYAGPYVYEDETNVGKGMFNPGLATWMPVYRRVMSEWGKQTQLSWRKLPTSSEQNLIMLLAEIDESILSLAKLLWGKLTVGDVSYGIIPIVSDVKAILSAIKRVAEFDGYYEDTQPISLTLRDAWGGALIGEHIFKATGTYRLNGNIVLPDIPVNLVLDWIGFHPDLATAWDLVPLSFLVNYLIPVGSFLESFRQGWVKAVYFSGFQSIKLEIAWISRGISNPRGQLLPAKLDWDVLFKSYSRSAFNDVLSVPTWDFDPSIPPLPTILQAFATFAGRAVTIRS